jgi:ferrochelatase
VHAIDAFLLVSFGGPEGPDDVMPFLRNVVRGRNVPDARLEQVAEHYHRFGGVSPINGQNRELLRAVEVELRSTGIELPVFWGNRNWHPLLPDTLKEMKRRGVRRAAAFVTSAFSSYSGCRQYLEDLARAREAVGDEAPEIEKTRVFFNHPGFIEANRARLSSALEAIDRTRLASTTVLFSAHSLPMSMARSSDYTAQLQEVARLTIEAAPALSWRMVYQSRSGPPTQPWLEPDVLDAIRDLHEKATTDIVVCPIGFVSDHMEVVYDLDVEAKELAEELGVRLVRAGTVGTHPAFVTMIRELVQEKLDPKSERRALGTFGPRSDVCPPDCCPGPSRRPSPPAKP